MIEEEAYAAVVAELRENGPRQGLWAKAFAEAGGSEVTARAAYMRARAQEILAEARRTAAEQASMQRVAQAENFDERAFIGEYRWYAVGLILLLAVLLYAFVTS